MENTHKINWDAVSADLEEKRKNRNAGDYGPVFKAAAVRAVFRTQDVLEAAKKHASLKPTDSALELEINQLLPQATLVTDTQGVKSWRIKDDIRQKVLTDFSTLTLAAQYLPHDAETSQDTTQRMLALYILGKGPAIPTQSLAELNATVSISVWLSAYISDGIPRSSDVQTALKRKEFLAPFQDLAEYFQGRKKELAVLDSFVQQSGKQMPNQGERYSKSALQHFSMMVYGIGGAGKTTLVAKFILKQLETQPENSFGFVYIDFDRPDTRLDPMALLDEIVRQLQLQNPQDVELLQQIRISLQLARNNKVGASRGYERDAYLDRLGSWWRYRGAQCPLLLVFDSFEEVQNWVGGGVRDTLLRFLVDLSREITGLKVVISGRGNVDYFDMQPLEIGDFDQESALAYLKVKGVQQKKCAEEIWKYVGGNPLDLKLAAAEAVKSGCDNLPELLRNIDKKRIREVLFRRQLEHIHDPLVQKLAVPGLVVRNVNAEIIREVLAEPCYLGKISPEESKDLMEKLQKEAFLVQYEQGNWRFRPDLRVLLIDLSALLDSQRTKKVHDLAVAYYAQKKDPASISEWVYHRLKRGDNPELLGKIDFDSIQPFLRQSLNELPAPAYAFLASGFGLELPGEMLRSIVDLHRWELSMAATITNSFVTAEEDYLRRLAQDLADRPERSWNSPLQLPEALLYERLDILDKAESLAQAAIHEAKIALDIEKQLDATRRLISIYERNLDFEACAALAKTSLSEAIASNEPIRACRAALLFLRAQARLNVLKSQETDDILHELGKQSYAEANNAAAYKCMHDLLPENFFSRQIQKWPLRKSSAPAPTIKDETPFSFERFKAAVLERLKQAWKSATEFKDMVDLICQKAPDAEALETLAFVQLNRPLRDVGDSGVWKSCAFDLAVFLEKEGLIESVMNALSQESQTQVQPPPHEPDAEDNIGTDNKIVNFNINTRSAPFELQVNTVPKYDNFNINTRSAPPKKEKRDLFLASTLSPNVETTSIAPQLSLSNTQVTFFDSIKNLIAEGNTEEAIESLLSFTKTDNSSQNDDIILLSSRYKALTRDFGRSLIGPDDYRRVQAQITYALLEVLNNISKRTSAQVATSTLSDLQVVGTNPDHLIEKLEVTNKITWLTLGIQAAQAVGLASLKDNQAAVVFFIQDDILTKDPKVITSHRLFFTADTNQIKYSFNFREFKGGYIAENVFVPNQPDVFDEDLEFHFTGFSGDNKPGHVLSIQTKKRLIEGSYVSIISFLGKKMILSVVEVIKVEKETFEISAEENVRFQPGSPVFDTSWHVIGMIQHDNKAVSMSAVAASLNRTRPAEEAPKRGTDQPPSAPPQTSLNAKKFVVLYEQEDTSYAQQLRKHLNVLSITGKILIYFLDDAMAGENPWRRMEDELRNADYVLCLVTSRFLAGETLDFALKSGRRVIPILVENVLMEGTGLENMRTLPSNGRSVSSFENQDVAFSNIVGELKKILV